MPKRTYEMWAIEAIRLVLATKGLGRLPFDEIKCIVNKDGHWYECYKDGETPEYAWQEELDALARSG